MNKKMDKDYNSQREPLILKEYGRNVQKLVKYIASLKDKEERTRAAHTLISLMKQLNPTVRENNDNAQRIWDHLFHMADFTLDIDSPYPIPEPDSLYQKPERLHYNSQQPKFKHYGKNIELLIQKAIAIEDTEEQLQAVSYIIRLMKTFSSAWNKDNIEDEVMLEHIRVLSEGKIRITIAELNKEHQQQKEKERHKHQQHSKNKHHFKKK